MTPHWADERLEVHRHVVGPVDNNVFVIRCKETGDGVMIDAANEHDLLLELCQTLGVRTVLETHGHWDHIQAVEAVRNAGYEVGVTAEDAGMLPSYDYLLEDDSVIEIGRLRIRTHHTPGHTPGSQCFLVDGRLVAGDTLFLDGCGRTDLPGSDPEQMYESLTTRLGRVSDDTILCPGHQYSAEPTATMGATRERNMVFRPQTKEQWMMVFGG